MGRYRFLRIKRKSLALTLVLALVTTMFSPYVAALGAATWTATSGRDTYDRPDMNLSYNIEYVSSSIFDNSADDIYFYLHFKVKPEVRMFNDGLGSWAFVGLDYNNDDKSDIRLELSGKTLKTDRTSILGEIYDVRSKTDLNCKVDIFTNLDEGRWWIGFGVSRLCISLPQTFGMRGYADYQASDEKSFDYAPDDHFYVTLPGANSSSSGTTSTFQIPYNLANESTYLDNFSTSPSNLTSLSEKLSPSVVTVYCANSKGSGWAIKSELGSTNKSSGYQSYIISNHHVVEDCLGSKRVQLELSDGKKVEGSVAAWNANSDVAGIITKHAISGLEWIGAEPKQGWWIGVLGSPGSFVGVLTTGIISSINREASTFTFTAPINPGNSGGPIFDSTGRVLGLATSKNLLSNGLIAEGSGNGHGVPLLCGTVILCETEKTPWGSLSKFKGGPSAKELDAIAKADAEAKAKADAESEAKLRDEMRSQCTEFNGKLDLAIFNANSARITYPASSSVFAGIVSIAPSALDCNYINVTTFRSELLGKERILASLEGSITNAIATAKTNAMKKTTITCIKGKLTKKVTAVNPKCPSGYKKK